MMQERFGRVTWLREKCGKCEGGDQGRTEAEPMKQAWYLGEAPDGDFATDFEADVVVDGDVGAAEGAGRIHGMDWGKVRTTR
jgi:hypothetical protein